MDPESDGNLERGKEENGNVKGCSFPFHHTTEGWIKMHSGCNKKFGLCKTSHKGTFSL